MHKQKQIIFRDGFPYLCNNCQGLHHLVHLRVITGSLLCNVVRVHKVSRVNFHENAIAIDLVSISTLQEADETRAWPCQVQPFCLLYTESNGIDKTRPD